MTENIKLIYEILNPRLKLLDLKNDDIDLNSSLLDQGIFDSLSFLEFVLEIETQFQVEFDFSELDPSEFNSINKLSNLIDEKR